MAHESDCSDLFWCILRSAELVRQGGGNTTTSKTDVQTIPLDQIWAFDMPGTHHTPELEPENAGPREAFTMRPCASGYGVQITEYYGITNARRSSKEGAIVKRKVGQFAQGFAVIGTGREALEGAV